MKDLIIHFTVLSSAKVNWSLLRENSRFNPGLQHHREAFNINLETGEESYKFSSGARS